MSDDYDPTSDRVYLYGSLIVQGLMFIALMVIAVLRFIATKQNTKLNTIKNIYYTNKKKNSHFLSLRTERTKRII